jgi:hypothetical protein
MRLFLSLLFASLSSMPCNAWDPIGDLRDPGRIVRNVAREIQAAAAEADRVRIEALVQSGAPAFEAWLNQSRSDARSHSKPIPIAIRRRFETIFSNELLDSVRFRIGDPGIFNLAQLSIRYGGAGAVTLNDTIVFRSDFDAQSNVILWAHELKHVEQFHDWGVRDFAIRYLRSWNSVENSAYAFESGMQGILERYPADADFDGDGKIDQVELGSDSILIRLANGSQPKLKQLPGYNTRLGIWLTAYINKDKCADLVHIITAGVDNPHYAHTHLSDCKGSFKDPDKFQFNAPGVANPQGDYNTALGYWIVRKCGGKTVLAHNPLLPDGRVHFWYPQGDGPILYSLSGFCN